MKKLALISLVLATASAFGSTYKGWVTDKACGVKGASAGHLACAQKCLEGGGTYVFILDKDKKTTYEVDNPAKLKGHEGHLVSVSGSLKKGKLHVNKVTMLKQPMAKKMASDM